MKKLVKELLIPGIIVVSMVAMTFMATFSDDIKTTAAVMAPSVYKSGVTLKETPVTAGQTAGRSPKAVPKRARLTLQLR